MDYKTKKEIYKSLIKDINEWIKKDQQIKEYLKNTNALDKEFVNNILIIQKYFCRNKICQECKSYANCLQKDFQGFIYKIIPNKDIWEIKMISCNKKIAHDRKQLLLENKYNKFYIMDFSKRHFEVSPIGFWKLLPEDVKVFFTNIIKDNIPVCNIFLPIKFIKYPQINSLYDIYVDIAIKISKETPDQIAFINLLSAINEYKKFYANNKNFKKELTENFLYDFNGEIKDCSHLFIINVGSETKYLPWFHNELFLNLINYRMKNNLKTFFISNFNINSLYTNFLNNPENKIYYTNIKSLISVITKNK